MTLRDKKIVNKILQSHNCCELCGSTRRLEAHHIIPVVFGGQDIEDNLIVICEICHQKLTPKSILIKQGLKKAKGVKEIDPIIFYQRLNNMLNENSWLSVSDVLDVFDDMVELNTSKD